jgi:hypothetical protein
MVVKNKMSEKICTIFNVSSEFPDEAIDLKESKVEEYLKTYNPEKLVFKENQKPTKFNVKRLSVEESSIVTSKIKTHGQEMGNVLAITFGLISIESPDGRIYSPEMTVTKQGNQEIACHKNPSEVVNYLADEYGLDIITELAIAIIYLSKMPLKLSPFLRK